MVIDSDPRWPYPIKKRLKSKVRCPKCGGPMKGPTYHRESEFSFATGHSGICDCVDGVKTKLFAKGDTIRVNKEHFGFVCKVCKYPMAMEIK